ncbi:MAG: carbohydrate kinase, partial [Butyrivibrio sp.]|nr:carbohydrate kinase [Butyrivibrio sp.]
MKLLCVGEMLIDFTPVNGMPNTYTANPGGAPANVAVSAARNGIDAGFLGKLGNDDFGRLLVNTLRQDGVERLVPDLTDEATTTMAFVTLDETGDRSFTFARKPGADLLLNEADVDRVDFAVWDLVHAGSVSQSGAPSRDAVLLALGRAKEAGKLVSFDINFRDKIWSMDACRQEAERIYPLTD